MGDLLLVVALVVREVRHLEQGFMTNEGKNMYPQIMRNNRSDDEDASSPYGALSLLQRIYRDPLQPWGIRMRAAIECLPFEMPKLSATTVLDPEDFAKRLDRAVGRSGVRFLSDKTKEEK